MNQIYNELNNIDAENISLFVLTRHKNKSTEHDIFSVNMDEDVCIELMNNISASFNEIYEHEDYQLLDYDPVNPPIDYLVEEINSDELIFFNEFINGCNHDPLIFALERVNENHLIWGFIIKIERNNQGNIFSFHKMKNRKLLTNSGIMNFFGMDGNFHLANDNIITIDNKMDGICFIPNEFQVNQEQLIYIISKSGFESMFNIKYTIVHKVQEIINQIDLDDETRAIFNNIFEEINNNTTQMKRLIKILNIGNHIYLTQEYIDRNYEECGVLIETEDDGSIRYSKENIRKILYMLNEDYNINPLTNNNWTTHGKTRTNN
ncbi:Kiwa anti-phage protein KwaB-like domain-containing protein [Methanobrevibacter sp. DSM 116169]|uniref:Kiwa anti-phage protein KwaB-like domain-containing protein n=1 Tax=Methanobrevibacter sp. DSM 116169 TaxID=3242727 RepID=UPI0038FCC778